MRHGSDWILLGCLLIVALRYDIRFRRIPNWLVLAGLAGGLLSSLFALQWMATAPAPSLVVFRGWDNGWDNLGIALLGAMSGLAVMLPLYMRRALGAGDVKLMMAIGAFLSPMQVMGAALLTFVAGGVLSMLVAIGSGSLVRVVNNLRLMVTVSIIGRSTGVSLRDVATTGRLPYAIAIATGSLLQLYLAGRGHWPFA